MCERKLSVCIIVKNEEENLKKCLLALLAFPFEIVVVDTGSADRTVEVAKGIRNRFMTSHGVMILRRPRTLQSKRRQMIWCWS